MMRRRLGGLEVSAIGLGAPIYGEPSADAVIPGLHRALDRGVDLVDTSDIYWHGVHEEIVGRAIKGRRDRVVLATKFGNIRPPGGTPSADGRPEHVIQACEASLRRLEVEVIDLYYIHRVDPTVPIEDTVGAMSRLVDQGKVRHLGICEAAPATLRRAHATHPMTALQTEYSLWSRDPEDGAARPLRRARHRVRRLQPPRPRLPDGHDHRRGRIRRGRPPAQYAALSGREHRPQPRARRAPEAAGRARSTCSPAQLALAWLLGRRPFIVPIPGTRQLRWLEENIDAAHLSPAPATLAALDDLFAPGAVAGARYSAAEKRRVEL